MLSINHDGIMSKFISGQGQKKVNLEEVTEKEILQLMAAKLQSIRAMILFFTVVAVVGLIFSLFALLPALIK